MKGKKMVYCKVQIEVFDDLTGNKCFIEETRQFGYEDLNDKLIQAVDCCLSSINLSFPHKVKVTL